MLSQGIHGVNQDAAPVRVRKINLLMRSAPNAELAIPRLLFLLGDPVFSLPALRLASHGIVILDLDIQRLALL